MVPGYPVEKEGFLFEGTGTGANVAATENDGRLVLYEVDTSG